MKTKKCIFHIPYKINLSVQSGTNIRPIKMIKAFKENGYEVEIISGYSNERKILIKNIKQKIAKGTKYDFLYSESSTMPTLLTDKNHIPIHPILDFSFLKYCSNNNIRIGLFYRDIHWKFDDYKNNVSFFKRFVSKFFYKYDLKKYNKLVDILYLPSKNMYKYLNLKFNGQIHELPPGAEEADFKKCTSNENFTIFYVGGLSDNLYNLELIFKSVYKNDKVNMIICCREKEWEDNKDKYNKYLNNRIKIIHESGNEIYKYIESSDLMCLYVKPTEYWKFAMPVKLFTYIGAKKPILAVKNTLAGEFVEKNNIGWCIEYGEKEIDEFLNYIFKNTNQFDLKKSKLEHVLIENTWKSRARKVINDLTK